MRALVGGIIGAAASSAAWLAFEHHMQTNYGWFVVLIGLVTGMLVHKGASGKASGGTLRGALAVVLTLAGIVVGPKINAKVMESQAIDNAKAAPAVSEAANESAADSDTELADAGEAEASSAELGRQAEPVSNGNYSKSALKKNATDMDMIWMCVASLLAYITGKGGETKSAATAEGEQGDDADQSGAGEE